MDAKITEALATRLDALMPQGRSQAGAMGVDPTSVPISANDAGGYPVLENMKRIQPNFSQIGLTDPNLMDLVTLEQHPQAVAMVSSLYGPEETQQILMEARNPQLTFKRATELGQRVRNAIQATDSYRQPSGVLQSSQNAE